MPYLLKNFICILKMSRRRNRIKQKGSPSNNESETLTALLTATIEEKCAWFHKKAESGDKDFFDFFCNDTIFGNENFRVRIHFILKYFECLDNY